MIVVNELDACDNFKSNFTKMKSLITDKRKEVEWKGIDPAFIFDCANYAFLSNDGFSVFVEQSDRCYMMPDVINQYKGNKEYFKNLLASLTQETANHFFTFLLHYQGIDVIDEKNIPMTDTKLSMMSFSISSALSFGKALNSGELNICSFLEQVNNERNRNNQNLLQYHTNKTCYDRDEPKN